MRKIAGTTVTLLVALIFYKAASAQESIEVSGIVTDQEKKEFLAGVAVNIKGTVNGTVTGNEGEFGLKTKHKLPFTLVFSSIGFAPQEIEVISLGTKLKVALHTQTVLGNDIV